MKENRIEYLLNRVQAGIDRSNVLTVTAPFITQLKEMCLERDLIFHVYRSDALERKEIIKPISKTFRWRHHIRSIRKGYRTTDNNNIIGYNFNDIIKLDDFRIDWDSPFGRNGHAFKRLYVEHVIVAKNLYELSQAEEKLNTEAEKSICREPSLRQRILIKWLFSKKRK